MEWRQTCIARVPAVEARHALPRIPFSRIFMAPERSSADALKERIERIGREAGAEHVAAAFYDYHTEEAFSYRGDEWFHAASTIKVPVLLGVFAAIEERDLSLDARVHVRNRFFSAVDGDLFRV